MLDGITGALHNLATVQVWIAIGIGSVIGLIFGIIPGISGMLALTLMLPFVFKLSPVQALPMMVAATGIQFFGGAVTAILINVPGTPGNSATLLDGFPMTQRGEAGRAIGAAEMSSALGNVSTSLLALAIIPVMLPMVMALRSSDMVFIIVLGLTCVASVASGAMVKGLISGVVGLLLGLVGFQVTTGVERFTFGSLYLYDGIPLVPLALGLFSVPEMIALATVGGSVATSVAEIKGMQDVWRGVRDVFSHWGLVIRSCIIGFIVGIIPGIGGITAAFVAYAQAKQTSKHPEKFGTGSIEGVIAPESANNACGAGDLLTTLALGIPGSGLMALLLGAMVILGLIPGPEMVTKHLDLSLTLLWVLILTGVLGALICLPLAPHLAKIALIPGRVLIPMVMVVAFVGAFSSGERLNDVIVLLFVSALGVIMRRYDFSRPALLLGFILGGLFEGYFFIAFKVSGPLFFLRPISLVLILIIIFVLSFGPMKSLLQRRREPRKQVRKIGIEPYLFVVVLVIMLAVVLSSLMMEYFESKLLPILVGSFGFVLAAIGLGIEISARHKAGVPLWQTGSREDGKEGWKGYVLNYLWVGGFFLAIYLAGFLIAIAIFALFYMKWLGTRWRVSAPYGVLASVLIYFIFERALGIEMYRGLLFVWPGY